MGGIVCEQLPMVKENMERGKTIISEVYYETLKRLRRAIRNKHCGLLTSGVVFLHEITLPHTAWRTSELLKKFKSDVYDHPLFSQNLAQSDFHLFSYMK